MPLRETAFQGYTFLALIYAGFAYAALYDLMRPLLRSRLFAVRLPADVLLCAALSLLCLAALTRTGCDRLRLYMPLPVLAGWGLYRLGLRRAALGFINFLRRKRKKNGNGE